MVGRRAIPDTRTSLRRPARTPAPRMPTGRNKRSFTDPSGGHVEGRTGQTRAGAKANTRGTARQQGRNKVIEGPPAPFLASPVVSSWLLSQQRPHSCAVGLPSPGNCAPQRTIPGPGQRAQQPAPRRCGTPQHAQYAAKQ